MAFTSTSRAKLGPRGSHTLIVIAALTNPVDENVTPVGEVAAVTVLLPANAGTYCSGEAGLDAVINYKTQPLAQAVPPQCTPSTDGHTWIPPWFSLIASLRA